MHYSSLFIPEEMASQPLIPMRTDPAKEGGGALRLRWQPRTRHVPRSTLTLALVMLMKTKEAAIETSLSQSCT